MERQPHNNPWAEKLLQVSMPDSGEAWANMEAILDRKMPRRVLGDGRRWLLLILLLLLLIGVCNCPGRGRLFRFQGSRTSRELSPAVPSTRTVPSSATPPPNVPAIAANPPTAATPATVANPPTTALRNPNPTSPVSRQLRPGTVPATAGDTHSINSGVPNAYPRSRYLKTTANPHAGSVNRKFKGANPNTGGGGPRAGITGRKTPGLLTSRRPHPHPAAGRPTEDRPTGRNPDRTTAGRNPDRPAAFADIVQTEAPNQPRIKGKDTTALQNRKTFASLPPADQSRTVPPAVSHKDSSHKKPAAPPPEQDQKQKDHGWVVGLGLNQFFPIGGESGSTYNSNGLTGTLTDYLPVPMVRYYLNRKTYLQLEAQFNTPQPTAKNLVISQPAPDTSTRSGVFTQVVSSANIQQLYYFNIPLSLHYSPLDNLNLGTGLQWSHLSNAIGEFDSSTSTSVNGNSPTVVDAKATRSFKGDTLYRRIKTNELRFLVDVNYTYKHFVLGLRYNQALSNFVNIQLPTGGTTQARNSSLQLYLRYILWDTRKKKLPPK